MTEQATELAIAEIWKIFKENDARQAQRSAELNRQRQETDRQFRETDARIAQRTAETDRQFKETDARIAQRTAETDRQFKETDARIAQRIAETDRQFKETDARIAQRIAETDRQFKETDSKLRRLEGLFGNQWGRLIEALVQPNVLSLFQRRGHDVRRLHQRSKAQRNGKSMEIDIILEDATEVVTVEVKSVVTVEAVNDFLEDLREFTGFFPLYKNYRIYGAVAGLEVSLDVERYATRNGLFVLRVTGGEMVQISNDQQFQPHNFGVNLPVEQ